MSYDPCAPLRIAVVGLGLIGGSLAKALKAYTPHTVCGCDRDAQTLAEAHACGAIDDLIDSGDFSGCQLLFVALYPHQTIQFVLDALDRIDPGTIVVDLCGVKGAVVEALQAPCRERGILFIGGHPMAGKERWGFSGADATLFCGASMLLTPDANTPADALALIEGLCAQLGFRQVVRTTPPAHDRMIAFTSQMAHLVSSAYVKSPRAREHDGFSAGSYRDLTRVARLNAGMWTELFLANADPLLEELDAFTEALAAYRAAIADRDAERLYALLEEGRKIKEALS